MMQTWHDYFVRELATIIESEVERLKDELAAGLLTSVEDYRAVTGKIAGLRACIDYMDEASSNVSKKLGA
jgi:hypothetical protein